MWIGISISGFYGDSSFEQLSLFEQTADNARNDKGERLTRSWTRYETSTGIGRDILGPTGLALLAQQGLQQVKVVMRIVHLLCQ